MDGRVASNVVELSFSGEAAAAPVGLPEEAAREPEPDLLAAAREERGPAPIARTRERIAAGFGRMASAFAGSKSAAAAAGGATDARVEKAEVEGGPVSGAVGAAPGAGKAAPSKGRMAVRASVSVLALGVAGGLVAILLPGHGDLPARGADAPQEPGMAAPSRDGHLMAPLASLATVRPREAVPEPAHVRPKDAGKDDLVGEIAALGPAGENGPGGAAKAVVVQAPGAPPPAPAAVAARVADETAKGAPQQVHASTPSPASVGPAAAEAQPQEATAVAVNEPGNAGPASGIAAPNEVNAAGNSALSARVEANEPGGKESAVNDRLGKEVTRLTGMITQLSSTVREVGRDLTDLKAQQKKFMDATGEELADFERRLGLAEAGQAVDGAKAAVTAVSLPPPAAASDAGRASAASDPDAALIPVRPLPSAGKRGGAKMAAKESGSAAPSPAPASAALLHYRVRAASPGLAMLAAVDQTGDEGRPVQVGVGGQVPGYGRVTKIVQRGLAWVVETEKGEIR